MPFKNRIEQDQTGYELYQGSKETIFIVGDYKVVVMENTGTTISDSEKKRLREARSSYAMWGDLPEDFYWDEVDRVETTKHYSASVEHTQYPGFKKNIFMRKSSHKLNDNDLPGEVKNWQAFDGSDTVSLQSMLSNQFGEETSFGVIARACVVNENSGPEDLPEEIDQRLMSAVAFASIQKVALQGEDKQFWVTTLVPELMNDIFSFNGVDDEEVNLDFTASADVLWLSRDASLRLDKHSHDVRELKHDFPGYWFKRASLALEIENLLEQGKLDRDYLLNLLGINILARDPYSNNDLAEIITKPRNSKLLTQIFNTYPHIFEILIDKCEDGPFSSILMTSNWEESVDMLLDKAHFVSRAISTKSRLEELLQRKEELVMPHIFELSGNDVVVNADLKEVLPLPLQREVLLLLSKLSDEELLSLYDQFGKRLFEVWEDLYKAQYETFEEFLVAEYGSSDLTKVNRGQFVRDLAGTEPHMLLPDQEDVDSLFHSRLYPLLSREEIGIMTDSTIVIVGASTASVVAASLAQYGIGRIIIIDPDTISQSNLNRIYGATQADIGKNKAVYVANHLINLNPSIKVEAYPRALDETQLKAVLEQADVVVEMVDHLQTKINVRDLVREISLETGRNDLYVSMATNVDEPLVTFERVGDPLMLNDDFTEEEIRGLLKLKNPLHYISGIIQIIGIENIPPRQMVNFILVAHRELSYLAQHGVSAAGAGWGLAYSIQRLLIGAKLDKSAQVLSVESLFTKQSLEQVDNKYYLELQEKYPDIFADYESLGQALTMICKDLFDIDYIVAD